MFIRFNRLFILVMLLITVCYLSAYAVRYPDWILGNSKKHPEETFMTGVGLGDSLDEARSQARAEIAKVFKSRVVQLVEDTQRESSIKRDNKAETTDESSTEAITKVYVDEILEGVEIAKIWYDSKKQIYYALAVLNKKKANKSLTKQIEETQALLDSWIDAADTSESKIKKVRALTFAINVLDEKQNLVNKKKILDPASIPDLSSGSLRAKLQRRIESDREGITFIVMDESPQDYGIGDIVSERLSNQGFKVKALIPEKADLKSSNIIKCSLELELLDRKSEKWIFYSWKAKILLMEADSKGGILSSTYPQGQVSQLTAEAAVEKAVVTAKQATGVAVEKMIERYVYGE